MNKKTGYDLGGSECPYDPDYTVVDIEPIPDYIEDVTGEPISSYEYIERDLRKDFTSLPARSNIRVGQVIRYLQDEDGYLVTEPIDPEIFRTFGCRLFHIWDGKGSIDLFDHIALLELVLDGLQSEVPSNVQIRWDAELINPPDEDMAADWLVTIILV